jgi:hypothetical protein
MVEITNYSEESDNRGRICAREIYSGEVDENLGDDPFHVSWTMTQRGPGFQVPFGKKLWFVCRSQHKGK